MSNKKEIKNNKNINAEIINLKKELMNFYFQKSTGQLEKTSLIKEKKKQIARINTKINEIKSGDNNA